VKSFYYANLDLLLQSIQVVVAVVCFSLGGSLNIFLKPAGFSIGALVSYCFYWCIGGLQDCKIQLKVSAIFLDAWL